MLMSLCPRTLDALAPVQAELLLPGSDVDQMKRRVSRTATLDGSAVFYDSGHAVADRDVILVLPVVDDVLVNTVKHFVRTYSELTVSIKDGCFICVIEDIVVASDEITIRLMLKRNA